ncbi:MAG: FAD-dependent oxidoreductase, partial [Candidatus Eremiobacteraeota bacterium]|nr:FAD-dependent oxidoreductase [Candidatus Eremiobacteraeota bacterium]
ARPDWIQPITCVVALERRPPGENHTITPPADYANLKAQQRYTVLDGYISKVFQAGVDMWTYRRYIDAANFNDPAFSCDLSMLNMGANDYQAATLPSGSATQDAAIIAGAREAALGFVYWLQTEVPRDDGSGNGYPNLKVRTDQFTTPDGTAAQPYIREGRRIKARYTIVQQDLDQAYRGGPRAKNYPDSCGIGFYGGLDIHGLAAVGMPQQFITIWPFQIPLRSLIPIRVTNLLPACKNIGTTHITNGAYRLHPVEWNVGEAAGMLARLAIENNVSPDTVVSTPTLLRSFQHLLLSVGVPLFWWTDIPANDPQLFSAVQLLGVNGIMSGNPDMSYGPNTILTDGERVDIDSAVGRTLNWPATTMTRGQAALWLVNQLGL